MRKLSPRIIAVLAIGVLVASVIVAVIVLRRAPYSIPQHVLEQNAFSIYVPISDSPWKIDSSATKYLEAQGVLTLRFSRTGSPSVTMTQQAQPGAFSDIPNYYSIMLNKLHEYREISIPIGTVALTHPDELKGGQSAVGNIRGTLFFAHPDKDMTDGEWKVFFSSLKVLR